MTPEEKINNIINEKLSVEYEDIKPDANFVEDLGADSLDLVELIMSLEEELDVDISDDDAENITTVQAAYDFVKDKLGEDKWNNFDG